MKGGGFIGQVAEPYAQALMSLAKQENLGDRLGEDCKALLALLESSEDLRTCLSSPVIDNEAKKRVLGQVVGDQLHPYMRNFLMLLVDRRRILYLEGICQQFLALLRESAGIVLAEVTSAVPLNDGQQESVRNKVIAMTGAQRAELQLEVDPELLGGVVIKVGSQLVDASLKDQLRRIGLKLATA
jgi:F-type H+-transporting ATPase subunit delta